MLSGGCLVVSWGVWGVSAGCLGVSERCLGDDRVVSWCLGGVRWCLGGVLDTFSDPGTLCPPPHDIRKSRTPCLIGLRNRLKGTGQVVV